MAEFFIGVDGGGTGCRAVVSNIDGTILGHGRSGSANIVTDPQTSLVNVRAAIDNAFSDAGLDNSHYATSHAVLGLAGGNVEGAGIPIENGLPFAHANVEFDGLIALQGALGDQDGIVAILGTGTAYIVRKDDRIHSVGGWGFPLSDLGSGARLGQSLLQECLLAHDGIHPRSPLTTAVLEEFGNKPDNLVEFAWTANPGDFGKYAPRVFQYACQGDETARMLLQRSAGYVSETLDVLIAQGAERVSLLGGMAPLYVEWLPAHQQKLIVEPAADALTGALQLSLKRYGKMRE
ncbi:N-acetylglucosamine kinase [Ochrobactrum sp. CM-21-5]|nr:N-acetylglucosamine kinase [Ochrobactrum sp. CM-21-5]MBC2885326.1 N-acetylglucosamine kinase [Ochrobactrum sp. CM-21-5]